MKITKVITNKVQCLKCNTIIESVDVHDFISCKCGNIAVDGGHHYLRRVGNVHDTNSYIDLSETYEEEYVPAI